MSQRLFGWSAIARYLRISPSTAKKWYAQLGLPVRRRNNRVRSTTGEIDNWILALDKAHRELGVRGQVKLRSDRRRIVELALDKLWAGNRSSARIS